MHTHTLTHTHGDGAGDANRTGQQDVPVKAQVKEEAQEPKDDRNEETEDKTADGTGNAKRTREQDLPVKTDEKKEPTDDDRDKETFDETVEDTVKNVKFETGSNEQGVREKQTRGELQNITQESPKTFNGDDKHQTSLNEKKKTAIHIEMTAQELIPLSEKTDTGFKSEENGTANHVDKKQEEQALTSEELVAEGRPKALGVYKRRWYVLFMFSIYSFTQACVWNTFGPISSTSEKVFGWNDGTIALLSNWGPIAYIISGIFFSWMLDVKGLRWACLSSCLLVLIGTAVRCITMTAPAVTGLMHFGHFLNGLGGPVAMGGPAFVSAVWFPLHERATATAIGTAMNYMGVAIAFVLGPGLVHSLSETPLPLNASNITPAILVSEIQAVGNSAEIVLPASGVTAEPTYNATRDEYDVEIARARDEIHRYMIYVAAFTGVLFIVMLIYFPKKPPLPPCASAAIQRENFVVGLKHLLTRKMFWFVAFIYGVSLGVMNCWASVLNVNISPHGISEKDAGWIGFYAILSSCLVALILARFADVFKRMMKKLVIGLYCSALLWFILFALASIEVIPSPVAMFYVVIIGGMTSLSAAVPLIFELACELAYPTGEGTTNVVLTVINNIGGLLFLFAGMIPNIGTLWMNWTLIGSTAICLPLWLALKERYNRLTVDETNPTLDAINTEINIEPEDKEPSKTQ
nr:hypothetical protein BaRGS_009587 [Batillaria attramentaria]